MEKEILEGNKIIDIFMGKSTEIELLTMSEYLMDLKYHTSWDWLMPVVNKIICTNPTLEDAFKNTAKVVDTLMYVQIERTWQAVVQFIKWYNNKKH